MIVYLDTSALVKLFVAEAQWRHWEILDATETLIRRDADLSREYHLRGYDSLHLAAAESVFKAFQGQMPFHFPVSTSG